jgi:hypothetical protein
MIALIWLIGGGSNSEKKQIAKAPFVSSNWSKKFQLADKEPLGLYLFNELAKAHISKQNKVKAIDAWSDLDTSQAFIMEPKTFMFVGNIFAIFDNEIDSLMDHIEKGSTLFLSFNDLQEELYDSLFEYLEFEYDYTDAVKVFANGDQYEMLNIYQNDTIADRWYAFGYTETRNDYNVLSSFMEMENFIEYPYGDGRVLVHSNPTMFYNYQVKRQDGFKYTEFVLNQIDPNQDILHMEFGRVSDNIGDFDIDEAEGSAGKREDSYLRLLFENETLLIAWLLVILAIFLFVIFRTKRTRPEVPYLEPNKDMTLAFAETITSIYFAKRNPYGILQVLRKNFYNAIQRHFFIDLSRREGNKEIESLSEKSNIEERELEELIATLETKEPHAVSDSYVSQVQKEQHRFYRKVGIITDSISEETKRKKVTIRRSLLIPMLLVLVGIFMILFGIYFLTQGNGTGILYWPLGAIILVLGILRLSSPYLVIEDDKIKHYSPFATKKIFLISDFSMVDLKKNGAVLIFKNNRRININFWDMSFFDRKQFEAFVSKLHSI